MFRKPALFFLKSTVFTAVFTREFYKSMTRTKHARGDSDHYKLRPFTIYLFPDDVRDEDGDEVNIALTIAMPEYCPECMNFKNFVQQGLQGAMELVEQLREEMQ